MSHPGRRTFIRALTLLPFSGGVAVHSRGGQHLDAFHRGWNHPWIGYGHDFGRAWGHDGLSTSGWTCDTDPSSLGFTESEVTIDPTSGRGALRIRVDFLAGHPNRSRGGVSVSLLDHWPFACPPPATRAGLNLDGVLARLRIRLPRGSAGGPNGTNALQLILKTRVSAERWPSLHTAPVRIDPAWEERDVEIPMLLDARTASYSEPGVDLRNVSIIGLAMTTEAGGPARPIAGTIWIDDFVLETDPPLTFDFEQSEFEAQIGHARRRRGRAMSLVRFFVFCDGRAAPGFAPDGRVVRLDDVFYRDFDVLVRAAERQGVLLMPVLLDYGWCAYPTLVSGVQLGGHAEVVRDPAIRQTFFDHALTPLLERYGKHPSIYAWDVCNEPEWIIGEVPDAFRRNHDVVSLAEMRAFVQGCAALVHRSTPTQLVTVGSARRKWVQLWTECGLDLYQFHWYDHFAAEEPFPWGSYDELGLDRPCLVGEVPTESTAISQQEFVAGAEAGGYSGLLFWSYGARDPFSNLCAEPERPLRRPRRIPHS
jgi:hypothetical protein